ncbi:DUF4277 domain-containing protein [Hydrocoleum sp. CS-953]
MTAGQVVKGMVLNGLGLVSSPLYLFNKFFQGKAVEHFVVGNVGYKYIRK